MKKMTMAAAVAAAVLLAACGDSDDDGASASALETTEAPATTEAPTTTNAPATTEPVAAGSADEAMAEAPTPEGGMIVVNEFGPSTPEQIAEFQEAGPDGPIFMVNLLEFKDQAEYEDGRETDLTGAEAYAIYEEGVSELIREFGGEVVFEGDVTFLTIGQVDELWDAVGIARYPSRSTLAEMSSSPEFAELSVHRTAGLEGQLNIETVEPVG